jgi:hypothetical protein
MKILWGLGVAAVLSAASSAQAQEFLLDQAAEVADPAVSAWVRSREPAADEASAVPAAEVVHAAGVWSGALAGAAARSWTATRGIDGQVRGRVTLTGVPGVDGGNLEARLSGKGVVGKLLDDEGRTLADFEGALEPGGGAAGQFTARGGAVGQWTWPGAAE